MDIFSDGDPPKDDKCKSDFDFKPGSKDTEFQFLVSVTIGLSAFLAFCALRPRWKSLYSARKRRLDPSIGLPALPDTFFGWMPALYKVTEQQVLASAGLDAFVFLAFFKMAIKLFAVMFLFAAVVLEPINRAYTPNTAQHRVSGSEFKLFPQYSTWRDLAGARPFDKGTDDDDDDTSFNRNMGYLWSYLVFTYFFTGLTLYIMDKETFRVIRVRQDYLGTQSTITDRTFRLSGIPKELRTEAAIKDLVERLEIGKVECITLCRNWKEIDDLMDQRRSLLAKLEEAWSVYLNQKPLRPADSSSSRDENTNNGNGGAPEILDEEAAVSRAVESDQLLRSSSHNPWIDRPRPQTRFWYGFLRLQSRKTDAIDYYTEKLRLLDEKIRVARKKKYDATNTAFVTMDSIAACQMAIQALIDPHPGRLLTKPAPSPSDIVWRNTYASRASRRARSWAITIFVGILSIVWLVPVATLASALSICTIETAFPSLAQTLKEHELVRTLVQTGLPTASISLLNIAIPYLYDYLTYHQGMISRGDIVLSVVSKNFFFTFFNIFLIFTVFGAVTSIIAVLRQSLKDTTYIALTLARQIEDLAVFYANFIMLQGIGLFPFRLLEFGSVSLYPIYRLGAKTPRDFAEMIEPPMFYYGFYLPTALLVFILCLVYSVIPGGFPVLGLGLVYFSLGYFTYKYQLLYAMDQPQHATGGAWRMICYRILLGLLVFQLTMSGYLALRLAYTIALLITPLVLITLWYSYFFKRHFEPLTRFISLRSIRQGEELCGDAILDEDLGRPGSGREEREAIRRLSTIDEDREKGLRFVNPNLVTPLEQPWIYKDPPLSVSRSDTIEGVEYEPPGEDGEYEFGPEVSAGVEGRSSRATSASRNSSSSVSLGDTHIWRDG